MTSETSFAPSPDSPASPPAGLGRPSWAALLTRDRWIDLGRIVVTGAVAGLAWRQRVPLPVLWAAVAVGLYPLVRIGFLDLIHARKIGTECFVALATLIAVFGGEPVAGAVLMVIILIAEFIAELNTERARVSIRALIGSVPQTALVRSAGHERRVPITQLGVDDVVLVRAGERIPVDGTVVRGDAAVNEAPITGESVPRDKAVGSAVFAGTVIEAGALDIRTRVVGGETLFARIIALVEEAQASQAPVQKLADRVAAWLIPVVLVFLLAVFLLTRDVRMVVTLLVFTSPAELGLATPLVMIAAIARAARRGILVKGGVSLEALARADVFVFDKTGTLTLGTPTVERVEPRDGVVSAAELVRLAGAANRRSAHPLAKAVVAHAAALGVELDEPSDFEAIPGRGVTATVDGRRVIVGNAAFLAERGIAVPNGGPDDGTIVVHVAVDGAVAGRVHLADRIRPGARAAIDRLKATGVRRIVMLTGDALAAAQAVASRLGVDEVQAELLPEAKVRAVTELRSTGNRVAMVGDGINDAPALAKADVGVAMGVSGTQAALEAADVVLMTDDLSRLVTARAIARRAYRTIQENLLVGVGVVHVLGITAALLRWIGPIQAAILHLGPDVLVFLNSVKLLTVQIPEDRAAVADG